MSPVEGDRFLFVHMHKTAGTSLLHRIRSAKPADASYPTAEDYRANGFASMDVDSMLASAAQNDFWLIAGHFPLSTVSLLPYPVRTFTFLREPVARTLSALRHISQRSEPPMAESLTAIYDDPIRQHSMLRNHMVKMLALGPDELAQWSWTLMPYTEERLERAKQRLVEEIDVFGIQERFEDSCTMLAEAFGWSLGRPVVANTSDGQKVDPALVERIRADSSLDIALYEFAVEVWQERWARAAP